MIWLASFPRSGNTFFRNVLFEVYGLESSTYHIESWHRNPLKPDYDQYTFVKTHLLPFQLKPDNPAIKQVYIVRDGRDALVSVAHHRKDIVEPDTDYYFNLLEAILAMDGSYFGGWSENVKQWTATADIVIRFEDLITDPLRETEKLRAIMDLPLPQVDKLPTFEELKFGEPKYGRSKKMLDAHQVTTRTNLNFRRGRVGAWNDEMPAELEKLFWELHGAQMLALGYERGLVGDGGHKARQRRFDLSRNPSEETQAEDTQNWLRSYLKEFLYGMVTFQRRQPGKWRINLQTLGKIINFMQSIENCIVRRRDSESIKIGDMLPIYQGVKNKQPKLKITMKTYQNKVFWNRLSPMNRVLPYIKVLGFIRNASLLARIFWRTSFRSD